MASLRSLLAAQDMTVGSPAKRIIQFAIPMLLGNIAQQLYSTVDSIVLGQYVGDNALAAVGSAAPILNLLLVLFIGVSAGASIMIAQYFGAQDRKRLSESVATCIIMTALASLVIMILGPLVSRPILEALSTPASIIDWCEEYLNILFIMICGGAFYNVLSGILRGLGDSVSALLFLLVATLLNIVLDVWFVASFHWGVPGVAWATAIAQVVSAVLCMIRLSRMRETFDMKREYFRFYKEHIKRLIHLGIPSGITQMVFSLAMIIVQSLTNSFGETFIACNVIVMRIDSFAMMPNMTFGVSLTTYSGQNIGAGKMDRVISGTKSGVKIAVLTSVVITGLILLFGKYLARIFTNTPELIEMTEKMLFLLAVGYIAVAVTQTLSGTMRGAGDTMTPMWISLITTVAFRVPVAYGMAFLTRSEEYVNGRPESIFVSLLVSWVLGMLLTVWFYRKGKWKNKGIINRDPVATE